MKPLVSTATRGREHRPSTRFLSFGGRLLSAFACLSCVVLICAAVQGADADAKSIVRPEDPTGFASKVSVSPFGAGAFQSGSGDSAAGGGINMDYFFTEKIGVGVNYAVYAFDDEVHTVSADVVLRYPVSKVVAPYLLVGGGLATDGNGTQAVTRLGGGLDVSLLQSNLGVFADGVYNLMEGDKDFTIARLGVRLPF